jgi:putative sterol carrier protein
MQEQHKPSIRERIAQHAAHDPLLADFFAPFPNLLGRDLAGSFERMAKLLGRWKKTARLQFTLSEGGRERSWNLALTPKNCKAMEGKVNRPNLEIITDAETWLQIAGRHLSPLEAFGQGKMRVRGDLTLARLIARRLREPAASR